MRFTCNHYVFSDHTDNCSERIILYICIVRFVIFVVRCGTLILCYIVNYYYIMHIGTLSFYTIRARTPYSVSLSLSLSLAPWAHEVTKLHHARIVRLFKLTKSQKAQEWRSYFEFSPHFSPTYLLYRYNNI